jgi:hypothetical protein
MRAPPQALTCIDNASARCSHDVHARREREDARGTGCGKTARPSLCGGAGYAMRSKRRSLKKGEPRSTVCGKSHKEVAKLVGGPGVHTCDKCVGLCNDILADEAYQRRGYIHHLAVAEGCRPQGIGPDLLARSLAALTAIGIVSSSSGFQQHDRRDGSSSPHRRRCANARPFRVQTSRYRIRYLVRPHCESEGAWHGAHLLTRSC